MKISDMSISGDNMFISDVVILIRLRSVIFMVPVMIVTVELLPK